MGAFAILRAVGDSKKTIILSDRLQCGKYYIGSFTHSGHPIRRFRCGHCHPDRSGSQCCFGDSYTDVPHGGHETVSLTDPHVQKNAAEYFLKIGLPAGFDAIMYSISNIIVQVSINNFGVDTMAAWTAYSKIDFIFWMINSAFGISVMTFVGQNYGAGKWDRIRERYKKSVLAWH